MQEWLIYSILYVLEPSIKKPANIKECLVKMYLAVPGNLILSLFI